MKISKKHIWTTLFIVSLIGFILMAIYELGFYTQNKSDAKLSTLFPGTYVTRTPEQERLYFIFYFTVQSNLFALVLSALNVFWKNAPWESKHLQRLKVMMVVNLLITGLVYWIILAKDANWHNPFGIVSNMFVHLLVPAGAIYIFIYESTNDKTTKRSIDALSTTMWNYIFPACWLIVAIILFYATGAHEHSAIYGKITDFKNHVKPTVIVVIGIAIAYPALTYGASYLYSRKIKWA